MMVSLFCIYNFYANVLQELEFCMQITFEKKAYFCVVELNNTILSFCVCVCKLLC